MYPSPFSYYLHYYLYLLRNLNPGGFVELQDCIYPLCSDDDTLLEDSGLGQWSELLTQAFRESGRPMDSALYYEQQLADAGFINIHIVREKWPVNRWPRDKKYKQLGNISFRLQSSFCSPVRLRSPRLPYCHTRKPSLTAENKRHLEPGELPHWNKCREPRRLHAPQERGRPRLVQGRGRSPAGGRSEGPKGYKYPRLPPRVSDTLNLYTKTLC